MGRAGSLSVALHPRCVAVGALGHGGDVVAARIGQQVDAGGRASGASDAEVRWGAVALVDLGGDAASRPQLVERGHVGRRISIGRLAGDLLVAPRAPEASIIVTTASRAPSASTPCVGALRRIL